MKRLPVVYAFLVSAVLSCTPQTQDGRDDTNVATVHIGLKSQKPKLGDSFTYWSSGESINVFAKQNNQWIVDLGKDSEPSGGVFAKSPTVLNTDRADAVFAVPVELLNTSEGDWLIYAVSPSDCLIDKQMSSVDEFRFRLPYRQVPVFRDISRSFDSSCDIMIGSTDTLTSLKNDEAYPIKWNRLVSVLSADFSNIPYISKDEDVSSISLQAGGTVPLAGDFRYNISTGKCEAVTPTNILNIVSDGINFLMVDGYIKDVQVALMPQTLGELRVEIRTDRAVYVKSFDDLGCVLEADRLSSMVLDMAGAKVEKFSEIEVSPDNSLIINRSFDICIPEHIIAQLTPTGMGTLSVYSPEVKSSGAFDLHMKIFPMYVFGDDPHYSGDYYLVEGYILSHNALLYAERMYNNVHINAWYPSELNLEVQMLSPEGVPLETGEVSFFTDPEPSTTISSWTYTKGSSFSLGLKLTFGIAKRDGLSGALSWLNSVLGSIAPSYKHNNSSTQNLPDQTVQLSTESSTGTVSYVFRTNNDTGGYKTENIPLVFRNDQRIDFSWVWHLKSGKYCASDYDFGNMKIRATVTPVYKAAYNGTLSQTQGHAVFKGWATYRHEDLTIDSDMPPLNRIPAGDISLMFAAMDSNHYLTNLKVYRSGEYLTAKEPYYSDPMVYKKDSKIAIQLREGTYDILYKTQHGDGQILSNRIIENVRVVADETLEISSFDSRELQ